MTQLVQPNLTIVGKPGYCLAYTEDVFATPHLYYNATEGWGKAQFKHTDQPDASIAVPIWFSFDDPDGHVCVWANNQVYSTTAQGMKTFANIQALLNYMNNGTINEHMVYLGWSEDLATVRIVEGGNMGLTHDQVAKICVGFTNLQPETSPAFMNNIGLDLDTVLDNFENYTEHKNLLLDAQAYRNGETGTPKVTVNGVDYAPKTK